MEGKALLTEGGLSGHRISKHDLLTEGEPQPVPVGGFSRLFHSLYVVGFRLWFRFHPVLAHAHIDHKRYRQGMNRLHLLSYNLGRASDFVIRHLEQ